MTLRPLVYEFFFWFSRFEYALKESRFLKYPNVGDRAEPGWDRFISDCKDGYRLSLAGKALIAANPKRQLVTADGLDFQDVGFNPGASDLERVVRFAQAVRNNLFHGGNMVVPIGMIRTECGSCLPPRSRCLTIWPAKRA